MKNLIDYGFINEKPYEKRSKNDFYKLYVDLETDGLGGKFIIGIVYYDNLHYYYFTDFKQFLKILKNINSYLGFNHKTQYKLISHNGGKYDFRYLFEFLVSENLDVFNIKLINNSLLFDFFVNANLFSLYDSYLVLKSSLKDLSKDFIKNTELHKKEFNIDNWVKSGCQITPELKTYLLYDVISLKEIIMNFINSFKGIDINFYTIASISFNRLLDYEFRNKPIKYFTENFFSPDVENYIRSGYSGGRNEIFRFKTNKKIFDYDVNSLYPHCFSLKFPVSREYFFSSDETEILDYLDNECQVILNVDIEINYDYIPYIQEKLNNKLYFLYGNFKNKVITEIEFKTLKSLNAEIKINSGIIFSNSAYIFKDFVSEFYEIKKNADAEKSKRLIAKFFLNSCYGKFGQKREKLSILNINTLSKKQIDIYKKDWRVLIEGQPYRIVNNTDYHNRKLNVIYSLYTTSYSRDFMFKYIKEYQDNIYYTDTDCMFLDAEIKNNSILSNNELGKFKLEKTYNEGIFISNKFYGLIDENNAETLKIKGVFKDKKTKKYTDADNKEINYETLEKLYENKIDKITFHNNRLSGFLENFKRLDIQDKLKMQLLDVNKIYSFNYNKRIKNGNNTKPFNIKDLLTPSGQALGQASGQPLGLMSGVF